MQDEPLLRHLSLDTGQVLECPESERPEVAVEHLGGVLARARTTGRPARHMDDKPDAVTCSARSRATPCSRS